jgi:hypothetical protein
LKRTAKLVSLFGSTGDILGNLNNKRGAERFMELSLQFDKALKREANAAQQRVVSDACAATLRAFFSAPQRER